jgi:hypothetical protein
MTHSKTPLVVVFKLVLCDPKLRREFIVNPASVFKKLGLGCPVDFIGKNGKLCPVMPDLPDAEDVRTDISHPYWSKWLKGGVEQLHNFKLVLSGEQLYPSRSQFKSREDWLDFQEGAKTEISILLKRLKEN